jgi:GAF domain-containing protein
VDDLSAEDLGASATALIEMRVGTLAEHLAAVARTLQRTSTPQDTLETLCRLAVHILDAKYAAVTVVRAGKYTTEAATDEVCRRLDQLKNATAEGPCLDALLADEVVISNDLRREARWPRFVRTALRETPVRSMASFRLFSENGALGALNLYSDSVGAFSPHTEPLGIAIAAQAEIAYHAALQQDAIDNLRIALETSRTIGTAIGVLMAMHKITVDEAFDVLRTASQRSHRKLRDIAEDVVRTGTVP